MKKYEMTTAVNGGCVVKQMHCLGDDGETNSYGTIWAFSTCEAAGRWVDLALNPEFTALKGVMMKKTSLNEPIGETFKNHMAAEHKSIPPVAPAIAYVESTIQSLGEK